MFFIFHFLFHACLMLVSHHDCQKCPELKMESSSSDKDNNYRHALKKESVLVTPTVETTTSFKISFKI